MLVWFSCGHREQKFVLIRPTVVLGVVVVPCVERGVKGRVLSLVSVHGPASGASFGEDRTIMLDGISEVLLNIPHGPAWVIGGDFNAEIGSIGPRDDGVLGFHGHGRGTRADHQPLQLLGFVEVLFETPLAQSWSPYTDHNPIEVRLAKGWVFRQGRPPP